MSESTHGFVLAAAIALASIALVALIAAPASAAPAIDRSNGLVALEDAAPMISANWAGYVVSRPGATGPAAPRPEAKRSGFSSVFGAWVQPAVTCVPGHATDSAFWVGLGGFNVGSRALEQAGTEARCSAGGEATYAVWYEVVPAPPVPVKIPVTPGDSIVASVAVSARKVTVLISNYTRKETFTKKLLMAVRPDVSTADWITEAPSLCTRVGSCLPQPLANFGTVEFVSAKANAAGHTGPISDPAWSAIPVLLDPVVGPSPLDVTVAGAAATPSPVANDVNGSSFQVTWSPTSTITTPDGSVPPGP